MEAVIPGAICGGEQGLILNFGDQDDVRQQGQASLLDDIDRRLVLHVRDHGSLEECEQVGATSIRSNSAHTPIVGRNASHPLSPLSPKAGKDNVPWNDRNAAHGTIDTEVIDAIAPPVRSDTERQYEMRAVPKTTTPPPNSLFNTTLSKKELTQRAFQLYNSKKHSTDPTDSISLNELSEYRQFLYRDFIGQRNPGMLTMMRLKERYGVRPRSPDMLRWAFREWGFPRQRMAPDWMLHPVWICEDLGFDDDLTAFHIRAIAKKDLKGIDVHRAKAHKQYYTHKAEVMDGVALRGKEIGMQYRQKILGMERQRTWKAGRPHTFDAKTDAPLLEITPDHQQQYLLASPDSDKAEVRTHSNKRKRDDSVTLGLEFSLRQHELRSAPVPVRTPRIVFHNPYFAHAGTSNEIGHSSLTYNTTIPIALCVNIAPPDCPVILTGQYNLLEADSRSLAKWKGRSLPEYHIPALFRAALYSPIREEPRAWLGYVFTFKQQALTNLRLSAVLRHPKPVAMQVTIVQGVLPGHTGVTDLETDQDVREYVRRMNGSSMIFECTFERL